MQKIVLNDCIVADPGICHGKPTFAGTRVMVWQVLEMLADGADVGEVLAAFPSLKQSHIKAALTYASSLTRDHYVLINTQSPLPA